jgi:hypothetical protein
LLKVGRADSSIDLMPAGGDGKDDLAEPSLAPDRGHSRGARAPGALVAARQRLDEIEDGQALNLLHRSADRAGEAGRDVLEAELGVGLPQPVGVRAFIFAQQQADRLLALLERDVEIFAGHEGAAVDQHHSEQGRSIDRGDHHDQARIRGRQHPRRRHAHDDDIGGGRGRDRREDEGGARHHRRGDHAQSELLAVIGMLEEPARREAPDDADEDGMISGAVDRLARQRMDLAAAQLAVLPGEIEHQQRNAEQPQSHRRGGRPAGEHVADEERVEGLAPGRDLHRRPHRFQLSGAHASPPPDAGGCGAVEDDAPVELGKRLIGHDSPRSAIADKALGKRYP